MRVFHVSDTHLGYSNYAKVDQERGLNQREADFYDSFERFIDICLKEEPDLVLHTGDLFDSVRPSNRAISFAMTQLKRLSEAGIEFIAIAGNHETPRLKETGSVFRILEHLPSCVFAHEDRLVRVERDSLEIICIPHSTKERFPENLKALSELKKEGTRILMMHVGVLGHTVFKTAEANELLIEQSDIDPDAEYVALGHYHNHWNISNSCWFAGSTERISISEAPFEKGFIDLDIDGKKKRFVPLPTRRMLDLQIDLTDSNAMEARKAILSELERHELEGAIVRMTLSGISNETKSSLDLNSIRKAVQKTLYFQPNFIGRQEAEAGRHDGNGWIGRLQDEFKEYLSKMAIDKLDKKRLESMAERFFKELEE